jgi:cell division protein FtsB
MMEKKLESIKLKFKSLLSYAIWILVIMLLVSTVKNINRVIGIRKQVEVEKQKVEKMQADNAAIQTQIAQAQGQDYIDKQIRDKLGLTKDGEAVVVLPEESVVRSLAPPETIDTETLPDPNWKKWKKLFF